MLSIKIQSFLLSVIMLISGMSFGGREYSNDNIYNFVDRLYNVVLDRGPDTTGMQDWYTKLESGSATAANVAFGFFFSPEYQAKNKPDADYVNDLYAAMFGRDADASGFDYWTTRLSYGVPRLNVFKGFVDSVEFGNMCSSYGVVKGTITVDSRWDSYYYAHQFVTRFYEVALGRTPDKAGLEDWKGQLVRGDISGCEMAYGFIFSAECSANTASNTDFLDVLYRSLFGREPDTEGFNSWLAFLNSGAPRLEVFAGFVNSEEFGNICREYNISQGEYRYGRQIDPNKPMIALTFDDGPSIYTPRILDVLEQNNAVATFFVVGTNAQLRPATLQRAESIGCEIGNHSTNHPNLSSLSAAGVQNEINTCESYINAALGHGSSIMRPPYGSHNATVDANVGRPLILWSVDSRDWESRNATSVINVVLSNVRDGDVVLMHDLYSSTATAAETIIPELINRGYQLVTVSELAQYRGGMSNGVAYGRFRP